MVSFGSLTRRIASLMTQNDPDELLRQRIALLDLNQQTVDALHRIAPFIESCLSGIIEDFYAHMQRFPEGRKAFRDTGKIHALKSYQRDHWLRLFSAQLDQDYLKESIRIGTAHLKGRVPPHLYIAGYNFFLAALLKRVSTRYQNDPQLPVMCEAITKVAGLDMDLAMSVYLQQLWHEVMKPARAKAGE